MIGDPDLSVTGSLFDHNLNFFLDADKHVALQGVHAMLKPGLYPLAIPILNEPGSMTNNFSQSVLVNAGEFAYDRSLSC